MVLLYLTSRAVYLQLWLDMGGSSVLGVLLSNSYSSLQQKTTVIMSEGIICMLMLYGNTMLVLVLRKSLTLGNC